GRPASRGRRTRARRRGGTGRSYCPLPVKLVRPLPRLDKRDTGLLDLLVAAGVAVLDPTPGRLVEGVARLTHDLPCLGPCTEPGAHLLANVDGDLAAHRPHRCLTYCRTHGQSHPGILGCPCWGTRESSWVQGSGPAAPASPRSSPAARSSSRSGTAPRIYGERSRCAPGRPIRGSAGVL